MRFASLGSGSQGNAYLIETADVRVLVDCGFTARELTHRLALLEVEPATLDAILITHEHSDHVRGLGAVARRYRLATWMTYGTFLGSNCGELPALHLITNQAGFRIGDLEVRPYTMPHDAREPCQFVFRHGRLELGLLTDAGHVTPHAVENLRRCDGLILEFNHDIEMLASGPYPPHLQARVGGSHGHLNNQQSVALLTYLDSGRLQHLVAAHLSETNNTPQHVKEALFNSHQQLEPRLSFAEQAAVSGWHSVTLS